MDNKWFYITQEQPESDYSVVVFPYFGAGASSVAPWGPIYRECGFDFFPVQYACRESRSSDPPEADLQTMVRALVDDAEDFFAGNNLILYGRCYGSMLAYETAKYMRLKFGSEPAMLVVSASLIPEEEDIFSGSPTKLKEEDFQDLVMTHGYATQEQMDDPLFRDFFLPAMRLDYSMMAGYRFDEKNEVFHCPILALRGDDDPQTTMEDLQKWAVYTEGKLRVKSFPGEHFFENLQNIRDVAQEIRRTLDGMVD